ncbi:hypothetical protein I302_103173 [Kwoniella bestiolae CBS 10118]|uniref:Uncharacterized protein n=1 Tax=Kwoniella bestiolae CBS 10118 TaxID=1296100 RepID=A0A1B9G7N8_9TREE|nr:hypothetical protein I302_01871 [Kwoniella bestiolae CBS 10118]OCF27036.1 hypothetical protein I302_01871 [Kwoniella bestiolae CBS 10118]
MLSSITSLRNERRRTCELGKTRKALFETLAHLEGTDLKSTQKSYYDVRREDGMLRPEEATQNSELLKAWRDSTADDRMNRWTKNDWDRQTTDLNRECNKSKRKNAILMDDITRLRSLMSDRGENTSTGNTTDAGLSSLEASSADTLKRIRAKQAGWKPPKNPNEVELTDSSLSIELSLQKSETDSLNQSGSAKG